jgi:ATP-dependent Clp protease ATP-binding subunit ClpA
VYGARYISDRFLPDKAIDLVDEAASALRIAQESKPDELEALDRDIITLQVCSIRPPVFWFLPVLFRRSSSRV